MPVSCRALLIAGVLVAAAASARADERRLVIDLYTGHGTPQAFTVPGRVLRVEVEASAPEDGGGAWESLRATARALKTDKAKGATVTVRAAGREVTALTDDDGLFAAHFAAVDPPPAPGLQPVEARAEDPEGKLAAAAATGKVHLLGPGTRFALVSDIDDTILDSDVTHKPDLLYNTLFKNAHSMSPIPGTARLYQLLTQPAPDVRYPVFYLSGSPINLHARLRCYFELQQFPEGPLLLKNLNLIGGDPLFDQTTYKLGHLRELFRAYPDVLWLLFGDSGERDPEVYAQIRTEFPGRVAFTGIRLVKGEDRQDARFAGATATRTTWDAAVALVRAGHLTAAQALDVARATAGVETLPAGFGLDSELPAPPPAPAAVTARDVWDRLWAFASAHWKTWLTMAGWVLAAALIGAVVGAALGFVFGLAGFYLVRRRGWTRTRLRWYRFVGWLMPFWFAAVQVVSGAYMGAFAGGYVQLRGYILRERQVQKLLVHVIMATVFTREQYEASLARGADPGKLVDDLRRREGKTDAEVKRRVQEKVDEYLAKRPGTGWWEHWAAGKLVLLFLGMADEKGNLEVMKKLALLDEKELAAALDGDRTAAVTTGYALVYDWLDQLDDALCGYVRDFVLTQVLVALFLSWALAVLPIGVLQLVNWYVYVRPERRDKPR